MKKTTLSSLITLILINNAYATNTSYNVGMHSTATGSYTTAIGVGANAGGNSSSAIGANSRVDGINSVAIGSNSQANGDSSIANGAGSVASENSTAVGALAQATGENSMAVGASSMASGSESISIGSGAHATQHGSMAWGNQSSAEHANSVAIGLGSTTDRENSVSFGNSHVNRQLTGIAAGTQDTDAVNVSQLKSGLGQAEKNANNYTDAKISENNTIINKNIDAAKNEAINTATNHAVNASRNYTDQRFDSLNNKLDKAHEKINAGIAGVSAIASIPYVDGYQFSYGLGLGNYSNGNAIAAGIQYKPRENTRLRLNVSWDSSDNTVIGVGLAGGW